MNVLLILSELLGGLALFLFGLRLLSDGLATVAGHRLRILLERVTRRKITGTVVGSALGFLLHSSGATVMLIGFLNAGLITLPPLLAVLFGVNIGTTLSMQVLSLNIDALTFPAIALGMGLTFHRNEQVRAGGRALFGFGLLFLGMEIMSQGVSPWQDDLRPILSSIDSESLLGMITAVLAAALITAILQSSGATIGMCFAFIQGGVFDSLGQVLPLVLGAQVGTCITAALASIGGARSSQRLALAHVLFNVVGVTLALVFRVPFLSFLESTTPDMLRQTANLHTSFNLITTIVLLPFTGWVAAATTKILPVKEDEGNQSHLTREAMQAVQPALEASRKEITRLAELALESLSLCHVGLHSVRRSRTSRIIRNEIVFDTIKDTMTRQLRERGHDAQTSRAELTQLDHEIHRIAQVERIGDHLKSIYMLTLEQRSEPGTLVFGRELTQELEHLFEATQTMLKALADGAPDLHKHHVLIQETAERARTVFTMKMDTARIQPRVYYYYAAYLELFERLSRHIELAGSE